MLAFDLGASNGRGILGRFDGKKIELEELHRFENNYVDTNGVLHWGILGLYHQLKLSMGVFSNRYGKTLDCFGIDTWGVDYGLIDRQGQLLGNPICYRQATDEDMALAWDVVSKETLSARTGIAHVAFNTIYQLYTRLKAGDRALEVADSLLMTPDLLAYFFTGEKGSEYTISTTTMLYNPIMGDWDYEIIDAMGIPKHLFQKITPAGSLRGTLLDSVAAEVGLGHVPFAAVGSHDTASAVAAIPGKGNFAFCSSGTWSLFGVETDKPILTQEAFESNFSNEGTIQGGFRPLKNIMGLWIIQECRRDWQRHGANVSWDTLVEEARMETPFRSIIDPNSSEFFGAGNMELKIQEFCKRTHQPIPETRGQIARCVYESLALKYRQVMEQLEIVKGEKLQQLNIVGGGINNKLLNQMVADSINRPVYTGPVEGACIGNLLTQAIALGEISGIDDLREVVRNSTPVDVYEPFPSQECDDAYERLLSYVD